MVRGFALACHLLLGPEAVFRTAASVMTRCFSDKRREKMKSFVPKNPGEARRWVVVDAADKPLGTLAVKIANALRGKDRPTFAPQIDSGDFVVVINAAKVYLSGNKEEQKIYQSYSGHRSGLKLTNAATMRATFPERIIKHAVKGMLPKNNIARDMMCRLKVYAGAEHPHAAQKPVTL